MVVYRDDTGQQVAPSIGCSGGGLCRRGASNGEDLHRMAVRISLGDLPSRASLKMTGYLAGFVGSTTPGGVAAAAIVMQQSSPDLAEEYQERSISSPNELLSYRCGQCSAFPR